MSHTQILTTVRTEMERLDDLVAEYEELERAQMENERIQKQLQEERASLKAKLAETLQQKQELQQCWQYKLNESETISTKMKCDELKQTLESMYTLLGYSLAELVNVENDNGYRSQHIKLQYTNNENCFVILSATDIDSKYELITIEPQPNCLSETKDMLKHTQDVIGLLANVRKFFDDESIEVNQILTN